MGRKKAFVIAFVRTEKMDFHWIERYAKISDFFARKTCSKVSDRNVVRDSSSELRIISWEFSFVRV